MRGRFWDESVISLSFRFVVVSRFPRIRGGGIFRPLLAGADFSTRKWAVRYLFMMVGDLVDENGVFRSNYSMFQPGNDLHFTSFLYLTGSSTADMMVEVVEDLEESLDEVGANDLAPPESESPPADSGFDDGIRVANDAVEPFRTQIRSGDVEMFLVNSEIWELMHPFGKFQSSVVTTSRSY